MAVEDKLTSCLFLGIDICRTMEEISLLPSGRVIFRASHMAHDILARRRARRFENCKPHKLLASFF